MGRMGTVGESNVIPTLVGLCRVVRGGCKAPFWILKAAGN